MSGAVDAFLWRGSSNPPLVQRIAAWMFGIMFMGFGLVLLGMATKGIHEDGVVSFLVVGLISLGSFLVGVKIFRNGFPRIQKPAGSNKS